MSEWQTIESYDYLPARKQPKNALFRFEPVRDLPELFSLNRYVCRICTHWMPIPPVPEDEDD